MYFTSAIGIDQTKLIYEELFRNIRYKQLDMFLCGGMSTKKKKSYRDQLRGLIESERINVLYPEDLFAEMLNRKKYDLLTLEKVLARNSDVIVIIPESPGSFAELGAFANNTVTANKLMVFQHNKFKHAHSFIAQGPISYMQRFYRNSVYYFNDDMDETAKKLWKELRTRFKLSRTVSNIEFKDIDQLTGLMSFTLLLLFIYEGISVAVLKRSIKVLFEELKRSTDDFDIIYNSALKLMFKRSLIEKQGHNGEYYYCLTKQGFLKANGILNSIELIERSKMVNKIRLSIIRDQLAGIII